MIDLKLTEQQNLNFVNLFTKVAGLNPVKRIYYLCNNCHGDGFRIYRSNTGICFKCRSTHDVTNPFINEILSEFGYVEDILPQPIYYLMMIFQPSQGLKISWSPTQSPFLDKREFPIGLPFTKYETIPQTT